MFEFNGAGDLENKFDLEIYTFSHRPNNSRRGRPSKPVCGSDSSVPSDRSVQPTRPSKPAYTTDLADPSGQPSRPSRPNRPTGLLIKKKFHSNKTRYKKAIPNSFTFLLEPLLILIFSKSADEDPYE
ncbi:hypothetical protein BpHYR1_051546 [Brachionus plicatilis]|uniref:Uncharacterized protein n=1 Tax=Brachionus plicatilis TaxID=10195 RepID=A0A3M7Q115_BRAPC|nr:hypothetical protein BpHYR1_051546 [Brachionus plicatilis]